MTDPQKRFSTNRRLWSHWSRSTKLWAIAGLCLLAIVVRCSRRDNPNDVQEHVVFANDFEQLEGWVPDASSLTTERAHSGRRSVKIDAQHPFSITYRLTLKDAFSIRPKRMRLSTWAWIESEEDDIQLAFILNSPVPNAPALYSSRIYLGDHWPYKRWVHVSRDFDLPPAIPSQSQLVVFLWYANAQHVAYADDWKLTELH